MEKTPIEVLESEIRVLKKFQHIIETREGLVIDPARKEEVDANLQKKYNEISSRIVDFENAIKRLTPIATKP